MSAETDRVAAVYFDGKSARAQPVDLRLDDQVLVVAGDEVDIRAHLSNLKISEPLGSAPRLVTFPDGSHCEVHDRAAFAHMLRAGRHRDGLTVHLQSRWRWVVVSLLIAFAAVGAGYRWGLPAVSEWLAYQLPPNILAGIGETTLDFLDQHALTPSKLPRARQAAIEQEFNHLKLPAGAPPHRIVFRDGGPVGANAFALPNGTIVVTDQLVKVATDDREILGVLSHELGHLARRHSLRMLIQNSIVGGVVAWYMGDFSNLATGMSAAVLQAKYSRGFESEADDYAVKVMKLNGIPPVELANMLQRLQAVADKKHPGKNGGDLFNGYLDSHPATPERIRKIEAAG